MSVPTYEELIRRQYDNEACLAAFSELLKHPKDPHYVGRVFEEALPVLGKVMNSQFRRIRPGTEEYDEIVTSVPYSFYLGLISDRFYERFYEDADSNFSYLFGVFRFEVLNILKKRKRSDLNHELVNGFSVTSTFALESSCQYTEWKILKSQLPKLLIEETKKNMRFVSGDDGKICETILENLVYSKDVPYYLITDLFKVKKSVVDFFVQHVTVLIREALMRNKDIIDNMPHVMEAELDIEIMKAEQEVFAEGMHKSRSYDMET